MMARLHNKFKSITPENNPRASQGEQGTIGGPTTHAVVGRHRSGLRHRTKIVILILGGSLVLGGGALYFIMRPQPLLDPALVGKVNFPVYAPKTLPNGYTLKKDSQQVNQGVFVYELDGPAQQTIAVTLHSSPDGFDMTKMMEGGSISSTATPVGPMYNLSAGGTSKYLLDVGSELIFLTSPTKIDTATINALASSLAKVQ